LHQSLEEFSFNRYTDEQPQAYYAHTATALIDVLHQCSRLHKVLLTGDTLRCVNLEELLPYGHLFHELEFGGGDRTIADAQAVSNLLAKCSNLLMLDYGGSWYDVEQDSLVTTAIWQSCPLLQELELSWFSFNKQIAGSDTGAGAGAGAGAGIFTLINRSCKHLRALDLAHCQLSVSILRGIAGMEALKELTLYDCEGLTDAGMAVVATMKLERLTLYVHAHLTEVWIQSFVGSNISQSLETFDLTAYGNTTAIDDVQVATALASCYNLKKLDAYFGGDECVFGRNGLDGLQAMATGCPLLADIKLYLTVPGLHCLGTHFTNLKKCHVYNRCAAGAVAPEGFPSIEELQTLYPAVKWTYAG
jgi:hypothetical protein